MKTTIIKIREDIKIFFVQADSFPEGIESAHLKFKEIISQTSGRTFYGVSRPENKQIIYRAGAQEQYAGEGKKYGLESMVLKKGKYAAIQIDNYSENLANIGKAFDLILHRPDLDPEGFCVEQYLSEKEVICMVRLRN